MSSGTPDSPREWQAEFVGDPTRNCVVGSTAEHFPPARLDGYRLIAANETTRVATYRLASAGTAADSAASGPAGTRTEPSCSGSGQDDSGELRPSLYWRDVEALAAQLEPKAFDPNQPALIGWRKRTQAEALAHAAKVIDLGWRRVSVDDDTVERVAQAMWDEVQREFADMPGVDRTEMPQIVVPRYRRYARSVLRILSGRGHSDVLGQGEGSS